MHARAVVGGTQGVMQVAVTALAPERYKLQVTATRATHDKLRRAQVLLRHVSPSGDPSEIFDRALECVRQLPGVMMATPIDALPFAGYHVPPIAEPEENGATFWENARIKAFAKAAVFGATAALLLARARASRPRRWQASHSRRLWSSTSACCRPRFSTWRSIPS